MTGSPVISLSINNLYISAPNLPIDKTILFLHNLLINQIE